MVPPAPIPQLEGKGAVALVVSIGVKEDVVQRVKRDRYGGSRKVHVFRVNGDPKGFLRVEVSPVAYVLTPRYARRFARVEALAVGHGHHRLLSFTIRECEQLHRTHVPSSPVAVA